MRRFGVNGTLSVKDRLMLGYARVEPFGLSPVMPGTCGSFAALLLAPYLFMPLPYWARVLVVCAVFVTGGIAATRAEQILGKKDPGSVVIDEVFGQWLVYLPFATLSWGQLFAGFVLFRIFDMSKPPPVRASEDWLPAGWGVMIDDGVAGMYALLVMSACMRWVF